MTRPIEYDQSRWCTRKEAAAIKSVHEDTVDRWIRSGQVRAMRDPGGRVKVYMPDFLLPTELPARSRAS